MAATPTSKNWQRDAKWIRPSRPVSSRQQGISRAFGLRSGACVAARLVTSITGYLDAVAQAMGAPAMAIRATKLYGAP